MYTPLIPHGGKIISVDWPRPESMWQLPASPDSLNCAAGRIRLLDGRFDQDRTLALLADVVKDAKHQGFPLIRFVTHMEWALGNCPGVEDLL